MAQYLLQVFFFSEKPWERGCATAFIIGTLGNYDGNGNATETCVKTTIGVMSKTAINSARVSVFLLQISLPSLNNSDVKLLNFKFTSERE